MKSKIKFLKITPTGVILFWNFSKSIFSCSARHEKQIDKNEKASN